MHHKWFKVCLSWMCWNLCTSWNSLKYFEILKCVEIFMDSWGAGSSPNFFSIISGQHQNVLDPLDKEISGLIICCLGSFFSFFFWHKMLKTDANTYPEWYRRWGQTYRAGNCENSFGPSSSSRWSGQQRLSILNKSILFLRKLTKKSMLRLSPCFYLHGRHNHSNSIF